MEISKIWANLAVKDLNRTSQFYTALGLKPNGPNTSDQLTSFFFGKENFIIHFFMEEPLEKAIEGKLANLNEGNEIIFTLGTATKAEIDKWAIRVEQAGGMLVTRPEAFGNNYYGFVFADPDGHKFNFFSLEGM